MAIPKPAFVFVALVVLLAGCGSSDSSSGDLSIEEAWSRKPAPTQTVSAVYGIVANDGDVDVRLTSASSSVSEILELHETIMGDDGVMSMSEVEEGFVVPAGGTFTLEPGGPHIMVLGIDPATYPSDSVTITLTTASGVSFEFDAEVRSVTGAGMGDG